MSLISPIRQEVPIDMDELKRNEEANDAVRIAVFQTTMFILSNEDVTHKYDDMFENREINHVSITRKVMEKIIDLYWAINHNAVFNEVEVRNSVSRFPFEVQFIGDELIDNILIIDGIIEALRFHFYNSQRFYILGDSESCEEVPDDDDEFDIGLEP